MAAFLSVTPGFPRIGTSEFFKDSNAAFSSIFFKALVKEMPSGRS